MSEEWTPPQEGPDGTYPDGPIPNWNDYPDGTKNMLRTAEADKTETEVVHTEDGDKNQNKNKNTD